MHTVTQLNITIPNVPGNLANLTDKLRASDVNISAICSTEGKNSSILHLIVNDPETAKFVLQKHYNVTLCDVLAFELKNKPGAIANIARACAAAGLNIRNMYATTFGKAAATVYVVVDNIEKAKSLLKDWKKSFGSIAA